LIREYGPEGAAAVGQAHAAGAFGADYIANLLRQQRMRRDVQPPLRFQNPQLNELATDPLSLPITTLSSSTPKRTPMTSLQQKLNQLNLATMSQQLDPMLTDATAKNLSLAQTLEALVDRELEAVTSVPSERRFKLSACRACLRSIAFFLTITSRAYSSRPASFVCSISTSCITAPASVSSAIPA